jgi:Cu+-exporting ATPase
MSQTFTVAGLSCPSCVKHVTGALSALPDVTAVTVELGTPSSVHVDAGRTLSDDEVAAALAEEGDYALVE